MVSGVLMLENQRWRSETEENQRSLFWQMDKLRQPPELDFTSSEGNLSEWWKRWKQTMNLHMDVCMKEATEKEKCSAFLYVIGQDGRDIHNTFQFAEDEVDKIIPLIQKLDDYCTPKQNTTMERYKFNKRAQGETESVDQYITELRLLTKNCRFGDLQEELIRDRIICGINSERLYKSTTAQRRNSRHSGESH